MTKVSNEDFNKERQDYFPKALLIASVRF